MVKTLMKAYKSLYQGRRSILRKHLFNLKDPNKRIVGRSLLHHAIHMGNNDLVDEILSERRIETNKCLILAVKSRKYYLIPSLLPYEHPGEACLLMMRQKGTLPFHQTCLQKMMLHCGINTIVNGQSFLYHAAVNCRNYDMTKWLCLRKELVGTHEGFKDAKLRYKELIEDRIRKNQLNGLFYCLVQLKIRCIKIRKNQWKPGGKLYTQLKQRQVGFRPAR